MRILMAMFIAVFVAHVQAASKTDTLMVTPKIVSGSVADYEKDWPFIVSIQVQMNGGYYSCGGSYLGDGYVLTAAHCFSVSDDSTGSVYYGGSADTSVWYGSGDFNQQTSIHVDSYYIHPSWNANLTKYDAVVLKLSSQPGISAVNMGDTSLNDTLVGQSVEVAGWGTTSENGTASTKLLETSQTVISESQCINYLFNGAAQPANQTYIGDWSLCAYDAEKQSDSCQGDSGGPLVYRGNGLTTLVGIVSWGVGCARENQPAVYTNVSHIQTWVNDVKAGNIAASAKPQDVIGVKSTGWGKKSSGSFSIAVCLLLVVVMMRRKYTVV